MGNAPSITRLSPEMEGDTKNHKTNINSLPQEVLQQIAANLCPADAACLGLTRNAHYKACFAVHGPTRLTAETSVGWETIATIASRKSAVVGWVLLGEQLKSWAAQRGFVLDPSSGYVFVNKTNTEILEIAQWKARRSPLKRTRTGALKKPSEPVIKYEKYGKDIREGRKVVVQKYRY